MVGILQLVAENIKLEKDMKLIREEKLKDQWDKSRDIWIDVLAVKIS